MRLAKGEITKEIDSTEGKMSVLVTIVESKMLNGSIKGFAITLGLLASFTLFVLILITASDVLTREVANVPIPGAIQYSELLLVGVTFLALADGQRNRDHVAIELVTSRLPVRVAHSFTAFGYIVVIGVLLVAAWASLKIAINSFQRGEALIGVTSVLTWPARAVIPLGLFALALMMLLQVIRSIAISTGHIHPNDGYKADGLKEEL